MIATRGVVVFPGQTVHFDLARDKSVLAINKAMEELDRADYDNDADLVKWLREKVATFDFPEIVERLSEYDYRGSL